MELAEQHMRNGHNIAGGVQIKLEIEDMGREFIQRQDYLRWVNRQRGQPGNESSLLIALVFREVSSLVRGTVPFIIDTEWNVCILAVFYVCKTFISRFCYSSFTLNNNKAIYLQSFTFKNLLFVIVYWILYI